MIRAIVTDIEGTTSSLSFVHEVLFPYAREHLPDYITRHADDDEVKRQLERVAAEVGRELTLQESVEQLQRWIDEDRKIAPLKALQGMVWEAGYRAGDFTGHVYEDAVRNLRRWHEKGLLLYVYSSGSVYAQKLLFGFSDYGDLTPLFNGYFDTAIGHKREADSYGAILAALKLPADEVLFLSDIREELDAAQAAGMQTCWLVREAPQPDPSASHRQARDFDGIDPSPGGV